MHNGIISLPQINANFETPILQINILLIIK